MVSSNDVHNPYNGHITFIMLVMSSPTQQDTAQPKNVSAPARASLILKDQEGICIPRKLIKETLDHFAQGMRKFTTIISSLSLSPNSQNWWKRYLGLILRRGWAIPCGPIQNFYALFTFLISVAVINLWHPLITANVNLIRWKWQIKFTKWQSTKLKGFNLYFRL